MKILLLDNSENDHWGGGQIFFVRLAWSLSLHCKIKVFTRNKKIIDHLDRSVIIQQSESFFNEVYNSDKVIVNDVGPILENPLRFFKIRKKIFPIVHMSLDATRHKKNGRSLLKGLVLSVILKFTVNRCLLVSRYNFKFISSKRASYIGNGIDVSQYGIFPQNNFNIYDFLWIGRFSFEKNPLLFLQACAELAAEGYSFKAAFVGDGPQKKIIKSYISNHLSGCNFIDYYDWVENPLDFISKSRVLVITSLSEGCPTVALEALLFKKLIVTTPYSDLDWWANSNIKIIDSVNLNDLKNAMKALILSEFKTNADYMPVVNLSFDGVFKKIVEAVEVNGVV